jgi:hypothetical protein
MHPSQNINLAFQCRMGWRLANTGRLLLCLDSGNLGGHGQDVIPTQRQDTYSIYFQFDDIKSLLGCQRSATPDAVVHRNATRRHDPTVEPPDSHGLGFSGQHCAAPPFPSFGGQLRRGARWGKERRNSPATTSTLQTIGNSCDHVQQSPLTCPCRNGNQSSGERRSQAPWYVIASNVEVRLHVLISGRGLT